MIDKIVKNIFVKILIVSLVAMAALSTTNTYGASSDVEVKYTQNVVGKNYYYDSYEVRNEHIQFLLTAKFDKYESSGEIMPRDFIIHEIKTNWCGGKYAMVGGIRYIANVRCKTANGIKTVNRKQTKSVYWLDENPRGIELPLPTMRQSKKTGEPVVSITLTWKPVGVEGERPNLKLKNGKLRSIKLVFSLEAKGPKSNKLRFIRQ